MSELGTLLVRAREARGLTLEDAERDTRISRRYLQALEAEQFDAIPAPVYARGFLRSYSQYLGLDPQEMLSLFPRPDDPAPAPPPRQSNGRPPGQASAPPHGPRPTWRGPQQPPARSPQQGGGQPRQQSATLPKPPARPVSRPDAEPSEPVIGVDIGVPAPSRRLNTDPAAQTRSVVIAVVAIGAVLAVVLLALLISNLGGGGSATPGISPTAAGTAAASGASGGPTTGPTLPPSGIETTPGVVPSLIGVPLDRAKSAIAEAGFKEAETHAKNAAAKGTVFDQSPAPGTQLAVGNTVTVAVSDGP